MYKKKIITLGLTVVMLLSMAVNAFAASSSLLTVVPRTSNT